MGLRIAGDDDDDDDDVDDDNDDGVELMMKLVEGVMEQVERFVSWSTFYLYKHKL